MTDYNDLPKIVDFHTHILPRVDHGSNGCTDTAHQLRLISDSRTEVVIATSHFYPNMHNVDDFLDERDDAIRLMRHRIKNPPKSLLIGLGAEVLLYPNMSKMKDLDKLCILGTKTILLELPFSNIGEELFHTVEEINDLGYNAVLAHVDRYYKNYHREFNHLFEKGVKAQVNSSAIASSKDRKNLFSYIDPDAVWALGSDLHGYKKKDYKAFMHAPDLLGSLYDEIMLRSEKLLEGASLILL